MSVLESPTQAPPGWRELRAHAGWGYAANGFVGWLFAATAPVAIILAAGRAGGLAEAALASWIFGVFFINGLITLWMSWRHRQPLAFFWTIPGTVLVGPALAHLSLAEVVGAYLATGVLMGVLAATGSVRRAMQWLPMPIVMGMVAGVFMRFGVDGVRALHADPWLAWPMVGAFGLLSAVAAWGRRLPPLIGALLAGALVVALAGRFDTAALAGGAVLAQPQWVWPAWSLAAMVELVVPLAITVLVVQNGQGIAVLRSAGHEPPVNAVALACGLGTLAAAAVGAVCSCLTGPTNAILTSSGERQRQYTAALATGVLALLFGALAPLFTRLALNTPPAFIQVLAGLAMLRVLHAALATAFKAGHGLGALVAMLVTLADRPLWNIGSAFWGLVAGFAVSWWLERGDFAAGK